VLEHQETVQEPVKTPTPQPAIPGAMEAWSWQRNRSPLSFWGKQSRYSRLSRRGPRWGDVKDPGY